LWADLKRRAAPAIASSASPARSAASSSSAASAWGQGAVWMEANAPPADAPYSGW
jgi:hypothetical protein